ncbi:MULTISPECIES: hypothetical protein [unclassified Massilia]|nr:MULTISPECIES: hypothetical protein [unclassified Massilia]
MSTIETGNMNIPNARHRDTCKARWNGRANVLAASGMIAAPRGCRA